jgi:hypothetical protein
VLLRGGQAPRPRPHMAGTGEAAAEVQPASASEVVQTPRPYVTA